MTPREVAQKQRAPWTSEAEGTTATREVDATIAQEAAIAEDEGKGARERARKAER